MKSVIKYLAGLFAAPLALALVVAILAVLLRLSGRRKAAAALFVSAAMLAWVCSTPFAGSIFLAPLENAYAPLDEASSAAAQATAIVVLGSAYHPLEGRPVTSALDREGLARIAEGVRLSRVFPSARLVVSGGVAWGDGPPVAQGYARFAGEMGVPAERLMVLDTPRNTAQEARAIAATPGLQNFILVTSASHMPRAMALMQRQGLHGIPAPTSHHVVPARMTKGWPAAIVPTAVGVQRTEIAWHEYVGLAAIRLGID